MPAVERRWLRLLLLVAALAAGGAGQYWLSIVFIPERAAAAWAAAAVCFVLLYLAGRDARALPSPDASDLSPQTERLWFALVFGIGIFFGLYRVHDFPPGLNHDAAWEGLYALKILQGIPYEPYVAAAWGRETFTFYLRALAIMTMGPTRWAVIAPSMVAGILILPFFYWWARNMFGARFALVALLLLGVSGWHLIFSRSGWRSDFEPLFVTLTCCFFIRGMLTTQPLDFALSGLFLAVTLNTYNAARVFPLLFPLWIVAVVLQSWNVRGFVRRYGVGLLFMAAAFALAIAPLAWYASHNWVQFQGRANALRGMVSFGEALRSTFLLYNWRGNGDDFFIRDPALEYPTAVFLVFGALWAILKVRDERALFIVLGMLVNFLPGLVSKPNMNRDIGTMPFVYLLVGLGILFFARELERLIPRIGRIVAVGFVLAAGGAATAATYQQYFGPTPRQLWGFYPETTVLGDFMRPLVPNYKIFIGDNPFFPRDAMTYLTFQGTGDPFERNYVWLDDLNVLLQIPLDPPRGKGLAFLVENANRGPAVFSYLSRRFPQHQEVDLRYPRDNGRVFARALLVPADAVAAAVTAPAAAAQAPEEAPVSTAPPGKLEQPRGVAITKEGDIVVSDFGHDRVQEFSRDLKFIRTWGRHGESVGEFQQPTGIAVAPSGEIFVADTWNQRVQVFSKTGEPVRNWGRGFYGPRGIAIDPSGSVFVSDTGNNRIMRLTATGEQQAVWGSKGSDKGQFIEPVGVATDGETVYVADNANGRLQMFDRDGKFLAAFPVSGWQSMVYSEPYIALDPKQTIWVTVPTAKEIRSYDRSGKLLRTITPHSVPAVTFETPMGIAYNPATRELVVADLEHRLIRIPVQK